MDRTDIKNMFLDIVGGSSYDEDTIDTILTDSLKLLNRLTSHIGIDFVTDEQMLTIETMQYFYDLTQRNYATAKEDLEHITGLAKQCHDDFIQVEQEYYSNYMGDR